MVMAWFFVVIWWLTDGQSMIDGYLVAKTGYDWQLSMLKTVVENDYCLVANCWLLDGKSWFMTIMNDRT